MILKLFRPGSPDRNIRDLYGAIVAQARSPAFYRDYDVPDTMEGRFDLIVLHLVLLIERLGRDADAGRGIGQRLFDAFCRDLDGNLREMGVGDLAVPKRMQRFGEAFYGRQAAYLGGLDSLDPKDFENALARNILEGEAPEQAADLARYGRVAAHELDAQEEGALLGGKLAFPSPEAFANGQS